MYQITKQFTFSASHQLTHLELTQPDHQCARLHGHNYRVEVVLEARNLNEAGFVMDYVDLAPFKKFLDDEFDHRHLNDVMLRPYYTTAEYLAVNFYIWCKSRWPQVVAVRVSETDKTWAEYRED